MWQRIQEVGKLLATIAVPVAIALVGYWVQTSLQRAEISAKMVELAIGILQEEPASDEGSDDALRNYGIDLLDHYSAVPVTSALRTELQRSSLPALEPQGLDVGVLYPTTWGSQPWGSSPFGGPPEDPDSGE